MRRFTFVFIALVTACTAPAPTPAATDTAKSGGLDANADGGAKVCSADSGCADAEFCGGGVCKPDVCQSGLPAVCDENGTKACAKNGSEYTTTPCAASEKCESGQCKTTAATCPPKDIKDDFAKSEQLSQTYKTCANNDGCTAQASDADKVTCFKACIAKGFIVSDSCGTCLGQYALCLFTTCKAQCSVDPSAKGCEACALQSCESGLVACK